MRTGELLGRIGFTLGALLLYRFGTYIPLPGIDPVAWEQIFRAQAGGALGSLNVLSGGAIHRLAIFAFNILPYLSASIIIQLMSLVTYNLKALKQQGERGRRITEQYTRSLAVLLAAFQAYGVATVLQDTGGVVTYPGLLFRLSSVLTLTGGTLFLIWLSGQITQRGIGNGVALLLFSGIVAEFPATLARAIEAGRQGLLSGNFILALAAIVVIVTAFVAVVEQGRRRLPVLYAGRREGAPMRDGWSELKLNLNPAGVIPVLLASWFLQVPIAVADLIGAQAPAWLTGVRAPYLVLYAVLMVLLALLYTAWVLGPEEAAESLQRHGGSLPGIAPGEATAAYLDHVISRTALIGAAYLALVCLLPEMLIAYAGAPFYFGGTSLLIVVCTTLDLGAQLSAAVRRRED
jgi:preprotein translocase subunit SecY